MRRGHAGISGWRNDNPRNFRPRGGGPPQFRPGRNYPAQETPRFPQPGSRPPRGTFNSRSGLLNTLPPDHHDRNIYRNDSWPGSQYRHPDRSHHQGTRSLYPIFDRMREAKDQSKYKERPYYDNTTSDSWRLNSMGDIDERQTNHAMNHELYGVHVASPWTGPDKRPYYDERNTQLYSGEISKIPVLEYSGHRPPSSDHYGGNPSSTLDNSNSFSRSVDDTVDIIRKRLQNRGENQESSDNQCMNSHKDIDDRIPNSISNQSTQQTQPAKKRVQRQRQNLDVNCDKMKNKIVHELFKMDKDKIHKLMDNPSSSSKFEYALNSFITESQNSLNRHLRSVAEKSLCTSEEFVHNDNNTIYEDTFMKQMQGVLDPQDTILLEDIKPLVLAELSKVLQLNEYDQPFQIADQGNYELTNENQNYNLSNTPHYEGYSENQYYEQIQSPHSIIYGTHDPNNDDDNVDFTNFEFRPKPAKPKPLFERRTARKSVDNSNSSPRADFQKQPRTSVDANTFMKDSFTNERRYSRRSFDNKNSQEIEPRIPLFDTNADQLSDEEDPFAEFDKQYHVAVDHNFIEADISSPLQSTTCVLNQDNNNKSPYHQDINFEIKSTTLDENYIKQEIDSQLQNIAKSSLKLSKASKTQDKIMSVTSGHTIVQVKQEVLSSPIKNCNNNKDQETPVGVNIIQEHIVDSNEVPAVENTENINSPVKVLPSNSRKRSIDQKPSHRKEKRKKSDSTPSDSGKQILNKNIIINVNDCSSNEIEKCKEAPKSIFNLYFSKEQSAKEVPKETKKIESTDKAYSEKYVKRKETQKKGETDTVKKRQRSVSSSHSIVSPKENLNNYSQGNKLESKTKLQSIDMFSEQPKKNTHLNQACKEIEIVSKPKQPVNSFNKKVTKRHISTQVSRKSQSRETQTFESKKVTTRFSQTERKKTFNKLVQTDPVRIAKQGPKATDTLERMKEIDLEIQVLLQEKFKLYNSIESGDPCPSTIQSLGVTVVNVTPDEGIKENDESEEETLSGDDIVEDFTNIPVEELEQLAFETIEAQNETKKKNRRQKIVDESRANSSSPTSRRNAKKGHTPNISLLEQIITDDRPLEDIISLDDLETTPVKSKKQKRPLEILLDDFETTPVNSKNKKQKKMSTKPKKKVTKKSKTVKPTIGKIDNKLIECFVLLTREDFSEYLQPKIENVEVQNENIPKIENVVVRNENVEGKIESIEIVDQEILIDDSNNIDVIEETVTNDVQFDMLDVSEDIVIGDNCEVKSNEDKDAERVEVVPSEEIILDNSQSSESVQVDFNQSDNICKMYDYSTDEILRHDSVVVTGHADAVLAIECIENNFIAACLDGNVYHFGSDGQLITTLRGSNLAVTCLTIVKEKYGTTVYTGSLDSRIRYYDLDTGLEKGPECNVLSPIQTMDRAWDTIFVGTRTGFVLQFECKNNMLIPVSTVKFSDQSILALRAMKEGPRKVLLVAARSEDVTIKDAQTGLLLRSLQGPKMTVYTLLYEDGKIYCGTSSHQIHVFDYASGSHLGAHEGGKGAVCLRAAGGLVFAGCYDGCVYIYREGEPKPLAQLRGPGLMLLSLAVLDTRIIAGYKDRSLFIWKIPQSVQQEMIL